MIERPGVSKEFKGGEAITDAMMYLKYNVPSWAVFGDHNKSYAGFMAKIKGSECNRL